MKIGIIGAGRMGSGLGKRWAQAGHQVMFGSRDPEKALGIATEVGTNANGANASGGSYADVLAFADVLLFAVPWDKAEAVLADLGSLDGKILIETTNNFVDHDPRSTTERIMTWAPGAKVVKAFNTIFAGIIQADPADAKERPSVFMAGDDADAKQITAQLISDAGFDPVDAGPVKNARHVENIAFAIVELAYGQGMGSNVSFKLIRV